MNVSAEAVLAGFYVYGAVCYGLIGAASIAWHNRLAFVFVAVGALMTAVSYLLQVNLTSEAERSATKILICLGWSFPAIAALLLMIGT